MRGTPLLGTLLATLSIYALLSYLLLAQRPVSQGPGFTLLVGVLPHLIAAVNLGALACLLLGWRAIRRGRVPMHRRFMGSAFLLIMAFLIMYVTRVYLGGIKAFGGPEVVYRWIYLPTLTIHVSLSILSIPLVVYNVLVGLTYPLGEVRPTAHPKVGRWAVALWSTSLTLGIVVYVMLNHLY